MEHRQGRLDVGIVEIDGNSPELHELRQLPRNDGGDTPRVFRKELSPAGFDVAAKRVDENADVKTAIPVRAAPDGGW